MSSGGVESLGNAPIAAEPRDASSAPSGGKLPPAQATEGAVSRALDAALSATRPGAGRESDFLTTFLQEKSDARALALWLGTARRPTTSRRPAPASMASLLGRDLARLDALISEQVNAILHQPRFQQLEATWRGLWYLTGQAQEGNERANEDAAESNVQIRILNVSHRELYKDLDGAVEFDQSQIFRKIYEDEFGMAGGEPFGVLIGDYQLTNHVEDIELLTKMSQVAAASFAPFITSASPRLLGLESFSTLEQPINLNSTFNHLEYLKWRAFRDTEESRFVGLVLPRVLMRQPYENDGSRVDGFRFREEVEGEDRSKYLWGSAAYAFGSVLIRAFAASGWFAEIRGLERGAVGGGLVTGLEVHSFGTDRRGVAPKASTEVAISDYQEKDLGQLGFIPLCHCHDTDLSVFYTNLSAQKPKTYDDPSATLNARISAMLQYMMCASRFAHYLKVLARNKVGNANSDRELEVFLNRWITEYVAADERAPPSTKARFPLREAQVQVREKADAPGTFNMTMHLLPHFQLDELTATLRLMTRLTPPGRT